jgi:tRNA modification GTPase
VILGRPNAGKSSLFNALVGASRAIVTDIPGTTRDLLTERVDIQGLPLTFVDTAGLREARDEIEAEGVRRARQAQSVAALALAVIDGSQPLTEADRDLVAGAPQPFIVIASKADLPRAWDDSELPASAGDPISVSAHSETGIGALKRRISASLTDREELRDPPAISNLRHLALVDTARQELARAEEALESGATEELVLADLGRARMALEEITGHRSDEDLLRHIFTRFCVGK